MYSHNTLYAPHCIAPGAGLPLCSAPRLLLLFILLPHHLLLLLPVHLARSAAEERHNYPAGDAHTCTGVHTLCDESSHTLVFGDPRRSLLLFVTIGASLKCVDSVCMCEYVSVCWRMVLLDAIQMFFLYSWGVGCVLDATALLLNAQYIPFESCLSHT